MSTRPVSPPSTAGRGAGFSCGCCRLRGRQTAAPQGLRGRPGLAATWPVNSADLADQRRAEGNAVKEGSARCRHEHAQHMGGIMGCSQFSCWASFEDVAPERLAAEFARLAAAQAEDAAVGTGEDHAEFLFGLGVTVAWLVAFTVAHDCWDWTTAEVQAYIIKPATAGTRQRYADLPHVRAAAGVGPADVFGSRE